MNKTNAIGVMDSGVGGLTVVRELQNLLPNEKMIYYGDTANCPYGNRSEAEIKGFTEGILTFLKQHQVKMVAIACNTMSTLVDAVKNDFDFEIIGIVRPAAMYIAKLQPKDVGVVATVFTVQTKEYDTLIDQYDATINVIGQGSPSLAAMIESGEFDYEKIDAEIQKEVGTLLEKDPKIKTIVLGCTHYPIVENRFQKLFPQITFVNPAEEQAMMVKNYLTKEQLLTDSTSVGAFDVYTSGDPQKYEVIVEKLALRTPRILVHDRIQ